MLDQAYPERVHLAQETADQPSGLIWTIMILVDKAAEPRIPRPPLATRRRSRGHMTEALEFRQRPRPASGQVRGLALRQAPRRPDKMRQARLPGRDPPSIHPIAITDQDPLPIVDEGGEGFFGAT